MPLKERDAQGVKRITSEENHALAHVGRFGLEHTDVAILYRTHGDKNNRSS